MEEEIGTDTWSADYYRATNDEGRVLLDVVKEVRTSGNPDDVEVLRKLLTDAIDRGAIKVVKPA